MQARLIGSDLGTVQGAKHVKVTYCRKMWLRWRIPPLPEQAESTCGWLYKALEEVCLIVSYSVL